MITRHLFGRSIDFRFMPIADGEDVPAYELVAARIYDEEPSDGQKANDETTGMIGDTVTSWVAKTRSEFSITFPPLEDEEPHSSEDFKKYYVNVVFRFQAGGPEVFVCEQIFVWRPDALTSKIRVAPADIIAREAKFEDARPTKTWIDKKIEDAIVQVDRELAAKGYSRKRTFNREKLNEAVELLATAFGCLDLAGSGNEIWLEKYKIWNGLYTQAMSSIPVGFDTDGDDRPDPEEKPFSGAVMVER